MSTHNSCAKKCAIFAALVASFAALACNPVAAATLLVAADGSTPYPDLASAAAAAASGDTVRIAAGVYTNLRTYTRSSGTTFEAIAYISVSELTILGESRDAVILGPESPLPNMEHAPFGINQVTAVSNRLVVRGVTVRNTSFGIALFSDGEVTASRLVHNLDGINAYGAQSVYVEDCEFVQNTSRGLITAQNVATNQVVVRNCQFDDNVYGVDFQSRGSTLENSTIARGRVGMQVSLGGSATVSGCTFTDNEIVGLSIPTGCSITLNSNRFLGSAEGNIINYGSLSGSGNILAGGTAATMAFVPLASFDFHDNHILNAGGYSAWMPPGGTNPLQILDLSNNHWGTTDSAQIDAWIMDHNDDERILGQVLYAPYFPQPIRTEQTTFGRLKSQFRP